MTIKIVGRAENGKRREVFYSCANVTFTPYEDRLEAELSIDGAPVKVLKMPEHGDTLFVINDEGKAVDCKRWPLKEGKEFRA